MRSILSLICLMGLLLHFKLSAQEKLYFDANWQKCKKKHASYYRLIEGKDASGHTKVSDYYMDGTLQMTGTFLSLKPSIREGLFKYYTKKGVLDKECAFVKDSLQGAYTEWYTNGRIQEQSNYVMSKLEGKLIAYDSIGKIRALEYYSKGALDSARTYHMNGQLASIRTFKGNEELEVGHCYDKEGKDTVCNVYNFKPVFQTTAYESHTEYIMKNFVMPVISRSKVQSKYRIILTIKNNGRLEDIKIVPKPVKELEDEILRVMWGTTQYYKPAYKRGVPVKSKMSFDINFPKR